MEYKIQCETRGAGISITEFKEAKDDKWGMLEAHSVFAHYVGLGLKIFRVWKSTAKGWIEIYHKENP